MSMWSFWETDRKNDLFQHIVYTAVHKKLIYMLIYFTFTVIAWCFLDKKALVVFGNGGEFSPWRIFVLICSFPSLLSVILIYFFPETPKFLISKRKFDEARQVFRRIYCINTSESVDKFPVSSFIINLQLVCE